MANLCINCRYYKRELVREREVIERTYFEDRCFVFDEQEHPVSGGKMEYIECSRMRLGPCGMDGKLFANN